MTAPQPNTMIGIALPDRAAWSDRVTTMLGKNPSLFTGPGTNTYLVGTGRERILLDTGQGKAEYLPILRATLQELGCRLQEIVLTHGHFDHIGGAAGVIEQEGPLRVSKRPWPGTDEQFPVEIRAIDHGDVIETEGATLRAVHAPGHAPDHLCFILEEEGSLFSGDNVLGVGTTVIPPDSGDLLDYMNSLERLLAEKPTRIYPAHGPCIEDGCGKLREYIDHRNDRERQIVEALGAGPAPVPEIVRRVYTDVPEALHKAAGFSVTSHLLKLEREGRAAQTGGEKPIDAQWRLA